MFQFKDGFAYIILYSRPVFPNLLMVGEQLTIELLEYPSYFEEHFIVEHKMLKISILWRALQSCKGRTCGPRSSGWEPLS